MISSSFPFLSFLHRAVSEQGREGREIDFCSIRNFGPPSTPLENILAEFGEGIGRDEPKARFTLLRCCGGGGGGVWCGLDCAIFTTISSEALRPHSERPLGLKQTKLVSPRV